MSEAMTDQTNIAIAGGVATAAVGGLINYSKYQTISHQSHIAIAGGLTTASLIGMKNYSKFKDGEISKEKAIKESLKVTIQGSIASIATITAAKSLEKNNFLGILTAFSVGAMGIYGIEQISKKLANQEEHKEQLTEEN